MYGIVPRFSKHSLSDQYDIFVWQYGGYCRYAYNASCLQK